MTPEQLQQIKHFYAAGVYRDADVISQLITDLEYQTAANEQADRIIIGLRAASERLTVENEQLKFVYLEDAKISGALVRDNARLTAELDELRSGLDGLLEKLRDDEVPRRWYEAAEVVRVAGPSVWPGEG